MTLAKRTLQHPGTRPLAWLLLSALLTVTWGVAPTRAGAQEVEARSAVVLDFGGDTTGGALLGRAAAAAMSLQMKERLYNVSSRADVIDAMNRLGIKEPLEADEIRALRKELDFKQLFTGQVASLEEGNSPQPWAKVILRVEVYDGTTGDLVNGAISEGYETSTGTLRDDQREALRNAAVERAVSKALGQIETRTLLTGAVLQHQPRRGAFRCRIAGHTHRLGHYGPERRWPGAKNPCICRLQPQRPGQMLAR